MQQPVGDIFYRYAVLNGVDNSVTYNTTKIEDDEDVTSMFFCHSTLGHLHTMELYVYFLETEAVYPTQSSQTDHYQITQFSPQEEPSHHNKPLFPDEEVGDDSDSDNERQIDLFSGSSEESGDEINIQEPQPIPSLYNPPIHLRNIQTDIEPASIFENVHDNIIHDGLEVGMEFENKEGCVYVIRQYHIQNSLDYSVYKSDAHRYLIKCVSDGCNFTCRASLRKGSGRWVIGKMGGQHTCMSSAMSQDHRKLNSDIISHSIRALVKSDISIKVKHIIAHVRTNYNYTISYKKAWIAKSKAIESIFGNWKGSYNDLSQWLLVMQMFIPGTIIELETLPVFSEADTEIVGARIFHCLFWAFDSCIRGFAYCKPIVQVDGTWLYGKYKGTLLMAVAQDGNGNIFPIAFALVEGETGEAWSFFLKNLRLHVTPQPDLCLIYDRHESIKSAYNNPDNGWQHPPSVHVYCIRHIAQNFMREIKDKYLRKKVVNMGYAMNEATYAYYREEIRQTNMEALRWVDNLPRDKWSRAYDQGRRWGHMTTNLVESMNSVLKETRNLPITALVKSTYFRLGELFGHRGHKWTKMLTSGKEYTDNCMKGIAEEVEKSHSYRVMSFDRDRHYFLVQETVNNNECCPLGHFNVDLQQQTCECGKFQTFHVPCSHAIAACSHIRQDYTVFIPDVYKIRSVFKVYEQSFIGVPNEVSWPQYQGDTILHNERMRRNKKGRPNSTRIRTEMDTVVVKEKRRCGICKVIRHMRKKCPHRPNAAGTSN